ncbi:nitroreductase family protein [Streptomyces spectabilis]|uniref:Nitroreductase n=2 Tax=Streptomyces spectabilis TaxID=68270 RepID=A0A5P2XML6_STRST|nr:nitroreductase family protein [Streptomyces spectabilis]MBB5107926.1 nitroreductase [Streptomyces spectabilis]MCI3899744.1 nitroreductase family protein [Streptomyces spectabilis]QEV64375.1 nitroreductase [Streptomyces spectabilis]
MALLDLTPDQLLTTTRSVRKRLDLTRPVPLALVKECIEIALQAPSGSNRQTWHWMVVTDTARRAEIGRYYQRAVRTYLASEGTCGSLFPEDPERHAVQQRVGDSVAYLGDHLGDVPVLVIPCLDANEAPEYNEAGKWGSIIQAAWSYMLAARARRLGTAWTTLHLMYEKEIAELLGLPSGVDQAALIPTAYSLGTEFRPAARQPLEQVLHLDTW